MCPLETVHEIPFFLTLEIADLEIFASCMIFMFLQV